MPGRDSAIDDLLYEARLHAARFGGPRPVIPAKHLAIVTCMDSRIDVFDLFGLSVGDAHVIRNAGGIITHDVLRSLVLSQRALLTREIVLVHHTDCGLQKIREDQLRALLEAETGTALPYAFGGFDDVDAAVRRAVAQVKEHPFLAHREHTRGFVYEVETGTLREIRET